MNASTSPASKAARTLSGRAKVKRQRVSSAARTLAAARPKGPSPIKVAIQETKTKVEGLEEHKEVCVNRGEKHGALLIPAKRLFLGGTSGLINEARWMDARP
jgi:hypothetical protein